MFAPDCGMSATNWPRGTTIRRTRKPVHSRGTASRSFPVAQLRKTGDLFCMEERGIVRRAGRVVAIAAALLVVWTVFGALSSAHFFFGYEGATDAASFLRLADNVIVFYWGWALLTPIVFLIARRATREGLPGLKESLFLIASGIAVMFLHGIVHITLSVILGVGRRGPLSAHEITSYAMRHGGGDLATFAVLVGAYLLVTANRRARARELAAAELESRLAKADLELLRWHLHPHFLFNALNTVSTLVLKGENDDASRAITLISRYLRAGIGQRADSMVPLSEDIAMVERYVEIETLRFGDSLRVEIDADDLARDTQIPSLILQPLVENAIAHGSVREPGAGPIRIAGSRRNGRILLSVSNPGTGVTATGSSDADGEDSARFGLRYVRERLRQFYGDDARFDLSTNGSETVASLDLPAR